MAKLKQHFSKSLLLIFILVFIAGVFIYKFNVHDTQEIPLNEEQNQEVEGVVVSDTEQETQYVHGYQRGPVVTVNRVPYMIRGNDRLVMCEQIQELNDQGDGYVNVGNIDYSYEPETYIVFNEQGYTVGGFTIGVTSTIKVPQWESSEGASNELKNDWTAFKNEIVTHEEGHQKILVDYATRVVNALNELPYYETQEEAKLAIDSVVESGWKNISDAEDAYDTEDETVGSFRKFCGFD